MSRTISTHYTDDDTGYCQVKFDAKNELFYIQYYDNNNHWFYTEEYPNKSIGYVQDAAENWVAGIKKLEEKSHQLSLF